jgi:hypothetical protein
MSGVEFHFLGASFFPLSAAELAGLKFKPRDIAMNGNKFTNQFT